MIRYVIFALLIVIGSVQWISSNLVRLTSQAGRSMSTVMLDPGHTSPVVVGCALMALFAAMLFRHVAFWFLAYAAILSISVGAFAGAMALMTSANLALPSGAADAPQSARRGMTSDIPTPPTEPSIRWPAGDVRLPK